MQPLVKISIAATTTFAMLNLAGGAYATGGHMVGLVLTPAWHTAISTAKLSETTGTYVDAQLITHAPEEHPAEAMLRVAQLIAAQSKDVDPDIYAIVDKEFWNLV